MENRRHTTIKLELDPHLWENIRNALQHKFPGQQVNVALTIPLCIGYKKPVSKESFAAIVNDCNTHNYPYQIVLYTNPNDPEAVKKWKEENHEALGLGGANVIDAVELRKTVPWLEASDVYDYFFKSILVEFFGPQNRLLNISDEQKEQLKATPQNIAEHKKDLFKDAGKFLSRNNPNYEQKVLTDLINGTINVRDLSEAHKKPLLEAITHIILEIKDCMVRMMRKKNQADQNLIENKVPTPTLSFLLYDGKLYESILHVISLAEALGYVKESITHAKYQIAARQSQSQDESFDLSVLMREMTPVMCEMTPVVIHALAQYKQGAEITPAEIGAALGGAFMAITQEARKQRTETAPSPSVYANNSSSVLFRRSPEAKQRPRAAAQNGASPPSSAASMTIPGPGQSRH